MIITDICGRNLIALNSNCHEIVVSKAMVNSKVINIDYEDIYDNINDYEYPYNHINREGI